MDPKRATDLNHIWHPFTPTEIWREDEAPIIARGEGFYLYDSSDKRYLDGVSSLWCNVHGHGTPELVSAIKSQSDKLCHSTLLGLSHEAVIELTDELLPLLPKNLTRIFYSDSGSAAVEGGLRMAVEYWQKSSEAADRKRYRLLSLNTGYHGDTLGSVSVGFVDVFHQSLKKNVIPSLNFNPPHIYRFEEGLSVADAEAQALAGLDKLLAAHGEEIAALIIEPLVQAAAGIWTHSPEFLEQVIDRVRKAGALVIIDEVATGFGKTGKLFAHQFQNLTPDILILGKSLSGGMLPLSAAVASEEIFSRFTAPVEELKTFYYGQTFAGNPLACAAATANLKLLNANKLLDALPKKIDHFTSLLAKHIAPLKNVFEIRQQGLMTGIELTKSSACYEPFVSREQAGPRIVQAARSQGLIIRPIGNVLILMPAIAMPNALLTELVTGTAAAVEAALN